MICERITLIAAFSLFLASAKAAEFSCGVVTKPKSAIASLNAMSTLGIKKLIFYRARFPDDKTDPVSMQEANTTLAEVNDLFTKISGGKFGLEWTVSPALHLEKGREAYEGPGGFDRFLDDVRAAGAKAGYDFKNYDLDIARHSGVQGFMGGNANLGTRGAQVQAPGAVLIVHELGHNLGLNHANFWVTGTVGLAQNSPPLPSNYPGVPDPRSIPVYPDSALAHESIIGPGYSAEYGDTHDIMGSGKVEFSTVYRQLLGWLEPASVAVATPGLTFHTIQTSDATQNLPVAIRVESLVSTPLGEREYWLQLPSEEPDLATLPGVEIRWAEPLDGHGSSLVLAPAASSPGVNGGVLLTAGKTFSDPANGVHITTIKTSGEGAGRTAELAIYIGNTSSNHAPVVAIDTLPTAIEVLEAIQLSATASDPDGDTLVWRWDFGDGFVSNVPNTVTNTWRRTGDFVVILEVSDLKGGVGRASLPIRVGSPKTARISGRVLTPEGLPVSGVRVHNGMNDSGTGQHRALFTFTDSKGEYILTGVEPGTYDIGAFLFGYSVERRSPVTVTDADLTQVDFTARELPRITVSAPAEIGEDAGLTNLFIVNRTGPTDGPVTVLYRLGGTTTSGRDYVRPFIDRLTIPSGASSAGLELNVMDDGVAEPIETVRLDIAYPVQAERVDEKGNAYTLYFPGWELIEINGVDTWVQTEPSYIPGNNSSTTVLLRDNDAPTSSVVSVSASDLIAMEEPPVESFFFITRSGDTSAAVIVSLEFDGTAQNGIDYTLLPASIEFLRGETERVLTVLPIADAVSESEEMVTLRILPGDYGIDLSNATVRVRDNAEVPQTISAIVRADGNIQLTMKAKPASRLVLETTTDFATWTPIRTNLLFNSDTAVMTFPNTGANAFYRTLIDKR